MSSLNVEPGENPAENPPEIQEANCRICDFIDDHNMVHCRECAAAYHDTCAGHVNQNAAFVCVPCQRAELDRQRAELEQLRANLAPPAIPELPAAPAARVNDEESVQSTDSEMDARSQVLLPSEQRLITNIQSMVNAQLQQFRTEITNLRAANFIQTGQVQPQSTPIQEVQLPRQPPVPARRTSLQVQAEVHQPGPSQTVARHEATAPPAATSGAANTLNQSWPDSFETFMARQLHQRNELPAFDGNPDEWPLFLAAYNSTSSSGRYSNADNILRLRKALKGPARQLVQASLADPNQVGHIIEQLTLIYGKPETIVNRRVQQFHKQPGPKAEKLESFIQYSLVIQNMVVSMESAGDVRYLDNPMLLHEMVDKLPPQSKLEWARFKMLNPNVNVRDFANWIDIVARSIGSVLPNVPSFAIGSGASAREPKERTEKINTHAVVSSPRSCSSCQGGCRSVAECQQFKEMSIKEKYDLLKKFRLCRICLWRHRDSNCKYARKCGISGCEKLHHRLLHPPAAPVTLSPSAPPYTPSTSQVQTNLHNDSSTSICKIARVVLQAGSRQVTTYALIDNGSTASLMDITLAKELQARGSSEPVRMRWTGGIYQSEPNSERLKVQIRGKDQQKSFTMRVRTVDNLDLTAVSLDMSEILRTYPYLAGLPLESYQNVSPRLIIGVDNESLTVAREVVERRRGEPIATRNLLGWVLSGPSEDYEGGSTFGIHLCECQRIEAEGLEALFKTFYDVESIGVRHNPDALLTREEKRARDVMEKTTKLLEGRYEVGLPWRYDKFDVPNSYPMAVSRMECLERKLRGSPEKLQIVNEQMNQLLEKGYAEEVPASGAQPPARGWYLPIFTVTNPNKPSKIRLVWDAAAKVSGISLNDLLLKGQDLTASLLGVLLRFREQRVAISGDIKEMYHQVVVREQDRPFQKFIWRFGDPSQHPREFQMRVMTFGATCSPYQAQYVKNKNASRFVSEHPRAVESIVRNHYVDDCLDGSKSSAEAISLGQQVTKIHAAGGFLIRNWRSNVPEVEAALNESANEASSVPLASPESDLEKVLGIFWNTTTDTVTFSLRFNKASEAILKGLKQPTKREVLRTLMSIYDPTGLLANFTVNLKIVMRDIWSIKIDWDQQIRSEENEKWLKWVRQLPSIEKLQISRRYLLQEAEWDQVETELHVFVDASAEAYAAVAYLRMMSSSEITVSFVGAKTHTAPLKPTSIPRLELQAAVIGVRWAEMIRESLTVKISRTTFWSDSSTVVTWINNQDKKVEPFVAFRVAEILKLSEVQQWRWIPTCDNVADEATKYRSRVKIAYETRWYQGPDFLKRPESSWITEVPVTSLIIVTEPPILLNWKNFSRYCRLLRSTAYVHRCVENLVRKSKKIEPLYGPLEAIELQKAEKTMIQAAQNEHFAFQISSLRQNRALREGDPLFKLTPKLEDGLLRIDGRIDAADVDYDAKHPIILPMQHRLAKLLVREMHEKCTHQFDEVVVNKIRQRFFIPNLRQLVKQVKKACNGCKIRLAKPVAPRMSPLPRSRLMSNDPPFSSTGLDMFGPFTVTVRRRPEKRWGLLFTCLTTRAVHIEMTSEMSTDAFLLCFRNFTNRRGAICKIHCDCGTNFKGAEKVLRELAARSATPTPEWIFNPPATPHMGGSWERMIRSVKNALNQMTPKLTNPSPEVLHSALIEVENILNSRPLTYASLSHENDAVLTPNHFLIGRESSQTSLGNPNVEEVTLRLKWRLAQNMAQKFWRKWLLEYLPELTRRTRWFKDVPDLQVGDVAVLFDEGDTKRRWRKCRVVEVTASRDGRVRRAKVQCGDGIYERPAVKIAKLDIGTESREMSPTRGNVENK